MRDEDKGAEPRADRRARLAAELRANLQKRKAQVRARRAGGADGRPEDLSAADGLRRGNEEGTGGR
jgi:hypothetical protein